ASARAGRALLLSEAAPARWGAARSGAVLRWVVGDGASTLDPGLTERLLGHAEGLSPADVSGVPASSLAWPRRVDVPLSALELPAPVSRRLQLAVSHARARVSAPWERRGGYRLLLSGLPGTGKTLTASAVATVLNRPLARIDLSSVLSKWLGETEQRLGEIFDLSEATGAVLVLDEAESLFRQRDSGPGGSGGLSTAVGFLLSRLDEFKGALIATTNRATDLDEAFFRRFDDYLVLPMPDAPTRERLWRRGLGDPPGIDWALLSERFMLSGGLIDGACRRALAWSAEAPLITPVVLASLALELEKNQQSASVVYACAYGEAVRAWLGEER
ncbi:ATP-binding protein, partial [Myxococcota bacterium]|nr:ATP-binding protein [Myxococcota bacterium]